MWMLIHNLTAGDASDPPPGEQHTEANHADSSQAGDESSHSRSPLPAQPSLAEARELLDAEHYGLDKVRLGTVLRNQ